MGLTIMKCTSNMTSDNPLIHNQNRRYCRYHNCLHSILFPSSTSPMFDNCFGIPQTIYSEIYEIRLMFAQFQFRQTALSRGSFYIEFPSSFLLHSVLGEWVVVGCDCTSFSEGVVVETTVMGANVLSIVARYWFSCKALKAY